MPLGHAARGLFAVTAVIAMALCGSTEASAQVQAQGQARPYQLSYYILGSVQRPGEYSYRAGMTVLHAIAVAGGYYRPSEAGLRLERDAAIANGDLQVLVAKRSLLRVRRARLQAELDEAAEIRPFPDVPANELAAHLREERQLMLARRKSFQDDLARLNEQVSLLNTEIASLQATIDAQGREALPLRRELDEVRAMVGRGLAPTARQYLLERNLAQIEGKQHELETFVARARQNISRTEQARFALSNQRRSTLLTEAQQTDTDIKELETRIETQKQLLAEAEGRVPTGAGAHDRGDNLRPAYIVLRGEGASVREQIATESTPLEPGDIVRVQTGTTTRLSAARD